MWVYVVADTESPSLADGGNVDVAVGVAGRVIFSGIDSDLLFVLISLRLDDLLVLATTLAETVVVAEDKLENEDVAWVADLVGVCDDVGSTL